MSKIALSGDASGTGTFTIASPNSNSNYQLDLPAESGTVLSTASTTGINASALSTGTIPKARMYAGAVLQVVQTVKSDTFSVTSTTFTDVTGLSVSITPSSATNKILVLVDCSLAGTASSAAYARLVRDSTVIYVGNTASTRPLALVQDYTGSDYYTYRTGGIYLDSPATTSSTTYKIQIASSSTTAYINRTSGDRDTASYDARTASSITVMEVVA